MKALEFSYWGSSLLNGKPTINFYFFQGHVGFHGGNLGSARRMPMFVGSQTTNFDPLGVRGNPGKDDSTVALLFGEGTVVLLMEEILHQLIGSISHYLQGFCIPGGAGFLPSTVSVSPLNILKQVNLDDKETNMSGNFEAFVFFRTVWMCLRLLSVKQVTIEETPFFDYAISTINTVLCFVVRQVLLH